MADTSGLRRFGDFTFDPASGELTHSGRGTNGVVSRLQPQVAALLIFLLERPGGVATRAELQARLWPDTTVDFDEGLNYSIRQLRQALGDDANAPRYIETLPRRGYRFIAPLKAETSKVAAPIARQRRFFMVAGALVALALIAVALARRVGPSARHAVDLAIVSFRVDTTDSLMTAYHRRLMHQLKATAGGESVWHLASDTNQATHVLSGALRRQGFSVAIFVQLVERPGRRHLWADSILDTYPFAGNSTLMADRIERSVVKVLSP
jgi:DNA-binding winged helix-turn-helix (wHTH) protein